MTREEAISIMKVIVHMLEEKYDTDRVEDAVDMAIKALEQEPCEDFISRQAVLDVIEREQFKGDAISEIEKLPPVPPKPKTGHWIENECSECGIINASAYKNYCPNCGAKMLPADSEKER